MNLIRETITRLRWRHGFRWAREEPLLVVAVLAMLCALALFCMGCDPKPKEKAQPELDFAKAEEVLDSMSAKLKLSKTKEAREAAAAIERAKGYVLSGQANISKLKGQYQEDIQSVEAENRRLSQDGNLIAGMNLLIFGGCIAFVGAVVLWRLIAFIPWARPAAGAAGAGGLAAVLIGFTVGKSLPYGWILGITISSVLAMGVIVLAWWAIKNYVRQGKDNVNVIDVIGSSVENAKKNEDPSQLVMVNDVAGAINVDKKTDLQSPTTKAINLAMREDLGLVDKTVAKVKRMKRTS